MSDPRTKKTVRNFFRTVLRSLTDLRFFREVREHRVSEAVGYLSILLIITWLIPFSVDFFIGVREMNDAVISALRTDVPADASFVMKDGKLTSNLIEPIVFRNGGFTFIVNSASSSLALSEDEVGIVVNQDAIVQGGGPDHMQIIGYTDIPDFEVDRKGIHQWVSSLGPWIILFVSTGTILAFSLVLVIGFGLLISLHAFILMLSMRMLKIKLRYTRAFTVASYTATLPIIVKSVADWTGANIGSASIYLYWILLAFIIYDFRKEHLGKMTKLNSSWR